MIKRVEGVALNTLVSEIQRGIDRAKEPTPFDGEPSDEPLYVLVCTKGKLAAIGAAFLELKRDEARGGDSSPVTIRAGVDEGRTHAVEASAGTGAPIPAPDQAAA